MAQPQTRTTPAEYLALDRAATTKSEFLDGEVSSMAGASRRHNLITLNIGAVLRDALRDRRCEVYPSDMRVRVEKTGLYTYPDVVTVCGEPRFEDAERDVLLNPTLLVEVLSPSTADYDRGAKFEHYRTIPSLQEVLLVAQDEVHVVHYVRQGDGTWNLSETRDAEAVMALPAVRAELPMREVYLKVPLEG